MKKLKLKFGFIGIIFVLSVILIGCSSNGEASGSKGSKLDQIKERDKLIVGVKYDMPLFGLKNASTGEIEGFDIDLAKALAQDLLGDENKIELVEATSKTRLELLKNENIDILIAYTQVTDERKKLVDFSDVYFEAGQTLLVPIESQVSQIEDVNSADKVIITAKGATAGEEIKKLGLETTVKYYENWGEAFTALRNGKGDTLMAHNAQLAGFVDQTMKNGKPVFKIVGPPVTQDNIAMAVKIGDEELLRYTNTFIKKIKEEGTYDELYTKWFAEAGL